MKLNSSNEAIDVSREIIAMMGSLDEAVDSLPKLGEDKAKSIAEYEKSVTITIMRLKNGEEFRVDGRSIHNTQATLSEKLAKGICWKEKIDMEKAEADYKNTLAKVEALKAKLNGWQSIYRHLSEV